MQALTSLFIVNHHIAHSWFIIHCAPFSNPLCDDWHWTNTLIWVWIMVGCPLLLPARLYASNILAHANVFHIIHQYETSGIIHSS